MQLPDSAVVGGQVLVCFYREPQVRAAALSIPVRLNDQIVGALRSNSFFYVITEPGNLTIFPDLSDVYGGMGISSNSKSELVFGDVWKGKARVDLVEVDAKPGDRKFFKFTAHYGKIDCVEMPEHLARMEMQDLNLLVIDTIR